MAGRTPPLPRAVARDTRLSRGERGLLAELWTRGPAWLFSVAGLYQATRLSPAVEGREALYRMVRHLGRAGYLETVIIGVSPGTGPGETGPSGRAWDSRYRLVYSAAPADDAGFVHVPWALARDRQLSYRDRGLLIERLSYGATVRGTTVAVHEGGADTLGGPHHGDGVKAARPALARLEARGYALTTRGRDERGRMTRTSILFRSAPHAPVPAPRPPVQPAPAPLPAAPAPLSTGSRPASQDRPLPPPPVDNPPAPLPPATCTDPVFPQVMTTLPNPGSRIREACPTCGNVTSPQVATTVPFPGAQGELSQGSLEGEKRSSGVLCVSTAQEGDAREQPDPLRGNEDHSHSGVLAPLQQLLRTGMTPDSIAATAARVAAEHPALRDRDGDDGGDQAELLRTLAAQLAAVPPPAAAAAAAEPVAEGGPVHRSGRRRRPPIARTGWDTLAQLPRAFRDGAPGWVRRELARRLGRLIEEEELTAAAIVATAQRLAPERIINRDHLAALDAVRTRLRVDLAAGDVCGGCGSERWTRHGRCPACDDSSPLDEAEQAQLAAAWTHLTGRPAPPTAAAAGPPCPDDWKPP